MKKTYIEPTSDILAVIASNILTGSIIVDFDNDRMEPGQRWDAPGRRDS